MRSESKIALTRFIHESQPTSSHAHLALKARHHQERRMVNAMTMTMTVSLVAAAVAALMMIVVQAGAAAAATTTSLPNPWPRRFKAHTLTYFPTNKNQVVVQLAAMFFDSTEQRQRFDHVVTRGQPLRPNSSRITTEIWRPLGALDRPLSKPFTGVRDPSLRSCVSC